MTPVMNRFLTPAALAVALLSAAVPAAHAQSKKELAAKIVQLQQPAIDAMANSIAQETAGRVMEAAMQAMAQVPADKREALGKQVQADVKAFYDDMQAKLRESAAKNSQPTLGPVFEEKFSEEELKQIATWLESGAAKKYQQVGGELQSQMSKKLVDDTRPAVEPKLKALEQTLQKRFSAYAPAGAAPASAPASGAKPAAPAKKK